MIVTPEIVQMDPAALQRVENLFREQIEQGGHPGAVLAVYRHGKQVIDLYGGVAEKFPDLRIGFLECGAGWVPYWMERMDEEWEKRGKVEAPPRSRIKLETLGLNAKPVLISPKALKEWSSVPGALPPNVLVV